jgi:hypothetical protein
MKKNHKRTPEEERYVGRSLMGVVRKKVEYKLYFITESSFRVFREGELLEEFSTYEDAFDFLLGF